MLACYWQKNGCSISCKTRGAEPPPLVNMVTVNLTDGIPEQSASTANEVHTTVQVTRSPAPSPRVSKPLARPGSHHPNIPALCLEPPQPSLGLWRYHSTGRMPKAEPSTPGILPPTQGLGNLAPRFCASTGHLYHVEDSTRHYPSEAHPFAGLNPSFHTPHALPPASHSRGAFTEPPVQPPSVQDVHAFGFPVPLAAGQAPTPGVWPAITVQSPTPPNKRRPTMSRWHSDSTNLTADAPQPALFPPDAPTSGMQTPRCGPLWRSSSVGTFFPAHSAPWGAPDCTSPAEERPPAGAGSFHVQPSAPPLDLL